MIHKEQNQEETDQDLVREYAESLIKEIKGFDEKVTVGSTLNTQQAIHAASITAKRLAKETAKKFYYQVTQYLMELNE